MTFATDNISRQNTSDNPFNKYFFFILTLLFSEPMTLKNCRCIIPVNIHSAVQPSIKPIPEASSNCDSTSIIELWLSVPRLLGVWLCRVLFILQVTNTSKEGKNNRGNSDFVLQNCLKYGLYPQMLWYLL